PGVTSHKLTPRTDALILIKRRRTLGPAKTKTLSRGLVTEGTRNSPGVTFSHKLSPRTDALLIKRRRKLGPAKTKTLSRGLPKGLEAVRTLLYIYSYTHPLNSLAWQSQISPLAFLH
ncbi:hypothetical protein TSAR_015942, partial [Trichomalopsis sarcophagae]